MKHKLVKAYRTAWRWPEVYSESPSIVWTSRALAFLVPASIVVLTLVTGTPLLGLMASAAIATVIAIVMMLATVTMFYKEYDSVEDFQSRESLIKEFFHGFPALTDVHLIENEPNEWVAYSHVDPHTFITAIETVIRAVTEDEALVGAYTGLEGSVGHLYATFSDPRDGHWGSGIDLCRQSTEGSFPITRITKE